MNKLSIKAWFKKHVYSKHMENKKKHWNHLTCYQKLKTLTFNWVWLIMHACTIYSELIEKINLNGFLFSYSFKAFNKLLITNGALHY